MSARQLAQWTRQLLVAAAGYKGQLDALNAWFSTMDATGKKPEGSKAD